ncbi:MAG: hypothetical protein HKP55_02115 [Gammaproteobacteria bacterium]|nr:hypothetical protein [Gammaproteobacteria bacterium]
MKPKFSFVAIILALLSACGVGQREIIVETCGEPIDITDCQWKGQLFTCVVTNRSADTYKGVPIWKYDEQGALLDKAPYRYATGLLPGDSSREKLPVTKYNKDRTVKIIFCRQQPAS